MKENEIGVAEVLQILDMSRTTLERRMEAGEIKALPKPSQLKKRHRLTFDRAYILALAKQSE